MRNVIPTIRWHKVPLIGRLIEWRNRRRRLSAMYDLFLPGLVGKIADFAKAGWRPVTTWSVLQDDARAWLKGWTGDHLHDFKTVYHEQMTAWVRSRMTPPT